MWKLQIIGLITAIFSAAIAVGIACGMALGAQFTFEQWFS